MDNYLFSAILLIVSLSFVIGQILSYLNHNWRRKPIPDELKDVYSSEKYETYTNYKLTTYRYGLLVSVVSFAGTILMLYFGFHYVDQIVSDLSQSIIVRTLHFFGIIGAAAEILSLPFDIYDTFVIEQKFGFNTTTPRIYITDKIKSWILTIVLGGGVLALVTLLFMMYPHNFWWMAWVFVSVIITFISLFYSSLIVPMFNKQTPLEKGDLRDQLEELGVKCRFNLKDIYVIDGSKRSTRANAYFSGFGHKKRIVLFDTLINNYSNDQIAAVLAHEIGHYRKGHTIFSLLISIIITGITLYIFGFVTGNEQVYQAFGHSDHAFYIALIVFVLLYSPLSALLSFAGNLVSRHFEYQADEFAVRHANPDSLITGLKKLTADNLSDFNPHPWVVMAYYSHPTLLQRVSAIRKLKAT